MVPAIPRPPEPPPEPAVVEIKITSSPAGAAVFEGSTKLGLTPLVLERKQSESAKLSLIVKKQDYRSRKIKAALNQDQTHRVMLKPNFEAVPFDP